MRKFGGFWLKKLFNWNSSFSPDAAGIQPPETAAINARVHYPGLGSLGRKKVKIKNGEKNSDHEDRTFVSRQLRSHVCRVFFFFFFRIERNKMIRTLTGIQRDTRV